MSDAAFRGHAKFLQFVEHVHSERRFILKREACEVLEQIRGSAENRAVPILTGTSLWRAQTGGRESESTDRNGKVGWTIIQPHPPERMKPLRNHRPEGRANPNGIPYLYLASSEIAAMSEMRAWIGAKITISKFGVTRDLKIVDCTGGVGPDLRTVMEDQNATESDGMWATINYFFGRPVPVDDPLHYISTQILSELFLDLGFDGVKYKSLFDRDAQNYAMFDLDCAEVQDSKVAMVQAINYEFSDRYPSLPK